MHSAKQVEDIVAEFIKNTKTTKISENEWKIKLENYSVSHVSVIQNGLYQQSSLRKKHSAISLILFSILICKGGYIFACFMDVFDQIFGSEFRLLAATINYFAPCGYVCISSIIACV